MSIQRDPKTGAPLLVSARELRLRYQLALGKAARFWEGLAEGKLQYTRCRGCGAVYFPPQADCPRCRASDVEWLASSGEGELVTWTVISVKPASFSHHPDYVVGVVRMREGFNVVAWVEADPKTLRPGMPLRVAIGKRPGEEVPTYWFRPLAGRAGGSP